MPAYKYLPTFMSTENVINNQRIAKNTFLLYLRTIFVLAVSLYTSRLVLKVLGVDDYGIYQVVGGMVTMFGILSNALSAAISRFITFELGSGKAERLKRYQRGCTICIGGHSLYHRRGCCDMVYGDRDAAS